MREDATVRPELRAARGRIALAGLAVSALAIGLAPLLMPADYSWLSRTISESAAQGVDGAWPARLGLLLFGLSVLLAATVRARAWGVLGTALHVAFGSLLAASAAFAARSWRSDAPFVPTEDVLHSVAATGMGFAFAFGVVTVLVVGRRDRTRASRLGGAIAVTASVVLPLGMTAWPDAAGLLQRSMFAIAYLWYAAEILAELRTPGVCAGLPDEVIAGSGEPQPSVPRAGARPGMLPS